MTGNSRHCLRGVALFCALVLLPFMNAHAQQGRRVSGTVVDQLLRPLAGTRVILASRERSDTTQTATDGSFSFTNSPRGHVVITAFRPGYAATQRYETRVKPGKDYVFEIRLYPTSSTSPGVFDPDLDKRVTFDDPRGLAVGVSGSYGSVVTGISTIDVNGTVASFRLELTHEFDSNWMLFARVGKTRVWSKEDLRFRYNSTDTLVFRDYGLRAFETGVQFAFLRNTRRFRPYGSAWIGLNQFTADVGVTTLAAPAKARSDGIVVGLGLGVQYSPRYNLAFDAGLETAGSSFEQWHFNTSFVAFPNARELPTEFKLQMRYWPFAH